MYYKNLVIFSSVFKSKQRTSATVQTKTNGTYMWSCAPISIRLVKTSVSAARGQNSNCLFWDKHS